MKNSRKVKHAGARNQDAFTRVVDDAVNVLCCASSALDAVLIMLQGKDGEDADRCRSIVHLVVDALGECSNDLEDALESLR